MDQAVDHGQDSRRGRRRTKPTIHLKLHQRALLWVAALVQQLWCRTLRFDLSGQVQEFVDKPPPPGIVILWHNRLFSAAEFYRRFFKERKLAAMISTSRDGAWLAELFRILRIRPVRGSRYNRATQALRELVAANRDGYDIGITPDGSRGPVYEMKSGAAMVAWTTDQPLFLLSFNFGSAWRLKTWDRFYVPKPFSRVSVDIRAFMNVKSLGVENAEELAHRLKAEMDELTVDA